MTEYSGSRVFQTWGEKQIKQESVLCACVCSCVSAGAGAVAVCPHLLCSCELHACAHFLDKASGCVLVFTIVLTAPPEPGTVSDRQESLCVCL